MTKKILFSTSLLILLVGLFFYFFYRQEYKHSHEDTIYRGKTVEINIPLCPLQTDSLAVESISKENNLSLWSNKQHQESYNLLENIATLWREQEFIDDFMVIGTMSSDKNSEPFYWEIIPYPKTSLNFLDQFMVVWRLAFGSSCLSNEKRKAIKNKYLEYIPFFSHDYQYIPEQTACPTFDVFCNPEIINKQILFEGRYMNLLYNYAPIGIGEEKLHFLIVSKEHRTGFPELTIDEYVEAQEITSKLITYYAKKNYPIFYLFHKTGKFAGQTVPHWHQHVIFAPNATNEFWGMLLVMRNMLFPTSPLREPELKELVNKYREEIKEAMNFEEGFL